VPVEEEEEEEEDLFIYLFQYITPNYLKWELHKRYALL
jgi:hypothetical protein